VKEGKMTSFD